MRVLICFIYKIKLLKGIEKSVDSHLLTNIYLILQNLCNFYNKSMNTSESINNSNKSLDVISNDSCSLIVFYHTKEISGMLQIPKIRFSLSFEQYQFKNLLMICESKVKSMGQFKLFQHHDEFYPIILQISNYIRIFLSEKEWQDLCQVILQTERKYCSVPGEVEEYS